MLSTLRAKPWLRFSRISSTSMKLRMTMKNMTRALYIIEILLLTFEAWSHRYVLNVFLIFFSRYWYRSRFATAA
jgi:hypothetical protein